MKKSSLADFDVREKAGAISVALLIWLVVTLLFAFLVNLPRRAGLAAAQTQVEDLNQRIFRAGRDIARLEAEHRRVMDGSTSLQRFYDDVLSTKERRLIGFQRELRQIAGKFNINFDAIVYAKEVFQKDKVARFSATMPLTGTYENLREFIKTVEQSENFIIIETIQLTNAKEGGVILSLAITLSTYFVDAEIPEDAPVQSARRG